jgi:hypothetical protein
VGVSPGSLPHDEASAVRPTRNSARERRSAERASPGLGLPADGEGTTDRATRTALD